MANVTYLFGAGASANTIPVVNNMKRRFSEIISFLSQFGKEKFNDDAYKLLPKTLKEYNDIIKLVIEDLDWLQTQTQKHQTIDTLAKRYYLTGSSDLLRLKKTLILYFTIEQLLFINSSTLEDYTFRKRDELRYDSFFASVLERSEEGEITVKNNLKILTWNYDQQIELALKTYIDQPVNTIKERYNIFPNNKSINSSEQINIKSDQFGVVKINGNAIWDNPTILGSGDQKASVFDYHNKDIDYRELLGQILNEYSLVSNMNYGKHLKDSLLYFNFSWESDPSFGDKYLGYENHIEAAKKIAKQTEYLVIIGYSFPVFNRSIDQEIINSMLNLQKVYIQDPNCEAIQSTFKNGFNILEERFFEEVNVEFLLEKNVDQFLIPFEL